MTDDPFSTMHVSSDRGVAWITFDNPPVNVIDTTLMRDLRTVQTALRDDPSVRVIVFSSANPDFFLAHVDMRIAEQMDALRELDAAGSPDHNVFQSVNELVRAQPQVTIVKLTGTARGGGAELVAAADMTFAAIETARLGQIEALMGIVPGGGGTQYLRERVGRNRALEIVLGADLFDAETAASYGWINRALPAAELDGYVERVAHRIAALPAGVIEAAKAALPLDPMREGLAWENDAWAGQIALPGTQRLMARALENGVQTPAGERDLEDLMRRIAR